MKLRSRRDERVEPMGLAERSVSNNAFLEPSAIYKRRRPPPSSRAKRRRLSRIASCARWPSAAAQEAAAKKAAAEEAKAEKGAPDKAAEEAAAGTAPKTAPAALGGAVRPQYGELFTIGAVLAASHAIQQLVAEARLASWPCSGSGRHRAIAAAVFAAELQPSEPLGPEEFAKIACAA
jgi:hypothetical protein